MTHWKKVADKTKYFGAYSMDGVADAITLTIASYREEEVIGDGGKKELCRVVNFKEKAVAGIKIKPMIFNATNCKAATAAFKTPDMDAWVGQKIEVYILRGLFLKQTKEYVDCLRVREAGKTETTATQAPPVKKRQPFDRTHKNWPAMLQSVKDGKSTVMKLMGLYEFPEEDMDLLFEAEDERIAKESETSTEKADTEAAKQDNE